MSTKFEGRTLEYLEQDGHDQTHNFRLSRPTDMTDASMIDFDDAEFAREVARRWNSEPKLLAQRDRLLGRLREIVNMAPQHPSKRVLEAARIIINECEE